MKQRKRMPRGKSELKRTELKRTAFRSRAAGTPNGPVKARRPVDTGPSRAVRDLVKARAARDSRDGAALCEVCGTAPGTNIHHRQPRGAGGCRLKYINDPPNLLLVCGHGNSFPGCHADIENDRPRARDMGWLVRRPTQPVTVSVVRRGVRVYLDDRGGVTPVAEGSVSAVEGDVA